MQRISLTWIITSVAKLELLINVRAGQKVIDVAYYLFENVTMIDTLYETSVYKETLRVSREAGSALKAAASSILGSDPSSSDRILTDLDVWRLHTARDAFRTVLFAELNALPSYLATGKEPYNVDRLITNGPSLFPAELVKKVPESYADASEVGKCLAYELGTACGFHTFRIVEAVARRYWDAVADGKPRPVPETIGNIAGQLEIQNLGEERVRQSLKQLAKLHRNPLAHHDVLLTVDEALGTIGMARSVVAAMLVQLPMVMPTTSMPEPTLASLFTSPS